MRKAIAIIGFIMILSFSGCIEPIRHITYIQDVDLNGLPELSPVRITKDKYKRPVELSAYLSVNKDKTLSTNMGNHSLVNDKGIFELDYDPNINVYTEHAGKNKFDFNGDNFHWNQPSIIFGVNFDVAFQSKPKENEPKKGFGIGLNWGVNYASISNDMFYALNFGPYLYSEGDKAGFRVDGDISFSSRQSTTKFFVMEDKILSANSTRTGYYYEDIIKKSFFNPSIVFTVNSKFEDALVNLYVNFRLGWSLLYDIKERVYYSQNSTSTEGNSEFVVFGFGLFKDIGENGRLIAGTQFSSHSFPDNSLTNTSFFVQYSVSIF